MIQTNPKLVSTSMWPDVINAIEQLLRTRRPELDELERMLETSLDLARTSSWWEFFRGQAGAGPFAEIDFRRREDGGEALLNLTMTPDYELVEDNEIILRHFGMAAELDIIPEAAPEGVVSQTYEFRGAQVTLQFATTSRRLIGVTIAWDQRKQGKPPSTARSE